MTRSISAAIAISLSLVTAPTAQEHKAPAAAASERSESSRSEWGWGPASSDLMKLGQILVFTPSPSKPGTDAKAHAFQADRGNRKGQYLIVSTAAGQTGAQSSEYHLLAPDKAGALPDVDVLGIHYIKVRPDRREAFERFVAEKVHPAVGNLRPDLRLLYYKAVRGPDAGSYITIFALTKASRDKYWPGGSDSDDLRAAFKPVQPLTSELITYLVEGSALTDPKFAAAVLREPRVVRLRADNTRPALASSQVKG